MSDQDWNEEPEVPPKKKGIPSWLLFCGGGCLIAVILGAIGAFYIVGKVKDAMNPEEQWSRLEEVMELDDRPPELQMIMGNNFLMDMWVLNDKRGYIITIMDLGESEAEGREEVFGEGFKGGGVPGLSNIAEVVRGEVEVQGRLLPIQRFMNVVVGQGKTAGCMVDITPEGSAGFMMLQLTREPGEKSKEVIPDEAVQQLLLPFRIGPEHVTYDAPGPHPQEGQTSILEESAGD